MSIKNAVAIKRRDDFRRYKAVVAKRQRDFVETGTALGMIRRDELHKEGGFGSFEEFVEAEFDMPKSTAYRLIDAARVVTILSQVGTIQAKITNQSQALQLAPLGLDREAMTAVIAEAERRGRITADRLEQVRTELYPNVRVIEGEVVEDALPAAERLALEGVEPPADPVDQFPAAKDAVQRTLDAQAAAAALGEAADEEPHDTDVLDGADSSAGPVDTSLVDGSGNPTEDHRDLTPGETDEAAAQPSSGPSAPAGVFGADEPTEPEEPHSPADAGEVEEQAPEGVPAPALPIPSWLRAVTAVNAAVFDLRQEDPHTVQLLIPTDLAGELGASIKGLVDFYKAMHEDVLGHGAG